MAQDKNKKTDQDELEETSQVINPSDDKSPSTEATQDEETLTNSEVDKGNEDQLAKPPSSFARFRSFINLYLVIFVLVLALAAGGIFAIFKFNDKSGDSPTQKAGSLTDKQIADLKGNTTLVGDAQQTLDIQGNSVFEGQVLMRKNLDVAGSIKVGGTLSLPAITVGGASSFGQIQVDKTLSVKGNTTLQGQLNVQKGLSVAGASTFSGALSAGQINVTTLQLSGDLVISKHIKTTGGAPSRSGGGALGGGGTVSVNGTDTAGTVTINTGGSPSAGCFVTINFTQGFGSTPHAVISPSNSRAGTLQYYANRTANTLSICTANTPSAGQTYVYDYIVIN